MKKTKSNELLSWLATGEELWDGVKSFEQLCAKLGVTNPSEKAALRKHLKSIAEGLGQLNARLTT
jgi:hypothetical protein